MRLAHHPVLPHHPLPIFLGMGEVDMISHQVIAENVKSDIEILADYQDKMAIVRTKHLSLSHSLLIFLKENRSAYARYKSLPSIIDHEEQALIKSAEVYKQAILSLSSSIQETKGEFEKINGTIFNLLTVANDSRQKIHMLRTEFHALRSLFEEKMEMLQQDILSCERLQNQLRGLMHLHIKRHYYLFWKDQTSINKTLFEAVANNDITKANALDSTRLDLNCKNRYGYTPLLLAINKGHLDIFIWLLKNNADPNVICQFAGFDGITPLISTILWESDNQIQFIERLLAHNADINKPSVTNHFTPLHWAAYVGNEKGIDSLLRKGANAKVVDSKNINPMMLFSLTHKNKKLDTQTHAKCKRVELLFKNYSC